MFRLSSPRRPAPGRRFVPSLSVLLSALLLVLALHAPRAASADTTLVPGDTAYTSWDVALHGNAGWDAAAVTWLPAGTAVVIWWGPVTASDGSAWYEVGVQDATSGFLPADALARGAGSNDGGGGDGGSAPPPVAEPAAGGTATVTTLLKLRAEPSY